ncbi:MAG TPA: PDZ domain-containing protein [Polyangiaceae bacterium]|jgi:predicted metalloprotease with PDZ domain
MAAPTPLSILHRLAIPSPQSHVVEVETVLAGRLPAELVLFMPVWAPGSYLVREYARHIEGLTVESPARVAKVRKNAWRVEAHGTARVVVRYRVYANELTVRTSHVDDTHAFLVGAGIFLGVEGHLDAPARVELDVPAAWRVATSLKAAQGGYEAPDFDTLVDSPIEAGTHREESFTVLGVPHRYSIWPSDGVPERKIPQLVKDTTAILEKEASLFGGAFPYDAYELLLHVSPRGRGGLEHRASAALIAGPQGFTSRAGYLDVLSLVAHEVFHAWNVKRIRPAGLTPYRYEEECYTRLLWWFEGATSYYDWRVLALAGVCTVEEYLDHLAGELAYLDGTPGRLVQALEDTSFDAWIKLYRPDENSTNSTVSYYRKGEVVCALLDLETRGRTGGKVTLDHVLGHLWKEYGARGRPVPEDGMQAIFEHVAGVPMGDLFDAWVRSAAELEPAASLARVGLTAERTSRNEAPACSLGLRVRSEGSRAYVASVTRGGAAARAGIDAGDEVLGVGGARVEGSIESTLRGRAQGDAVDVLVSRDGRILSRRVTLDPPRLDVVKLVASPDAPPAARAAFQAWLGAPHPSWETGGKTS